MSSGGGGGGNPLEQLKKDPLGAIVNLGVQSSSFGLVGYENGKIGKGGVTRAADESLGEITGRNMARDQMAAAEARINAEAAARDREQAAQRERDALMDRNASMAARGSRASARTRAGQTMNFTLGGDEQDFLGL